MATHEAAQSPSSSAARSVRRRNAIACEASRLAAAFARIRELESQLILASCRSQTSCAARSRRQGKMGVRVVQSVLRRDAPAFLPCEPPACDLVGGVRACEVSERIPDEVVFDRCLEFLRPKEVVKEKVVVDKLAKGKLGARPFEAEVHAAGVSQHGNEPVPSVDEPEKSYHRSAVVAVGERKSNTGHYASVEPDIETVLECLRVQPSPCAEAGGEPEAPGSGGGDGGDMHESDFMVGLDCCRWAAVVVDEVSKFNPSQGYVAPTRGGVRVAEDTASGRQMVSDDDTVTNPLEHHDDISQVDEIGPPDLAAPAEGGGPSDVVEAMCIKKRMCKPKRSRRAASGSNVDQQLVEAVQEAKAERASLLAKYGITGVSMESCPSGHLIELYTNATGTCSGCSASHMGAGYNCTSRKCVFAYCVKCVKRDMVEEAAKGAGKGSAG